VAEVAAPVGTPAAAARPPAALPIGLVALDVDGTLIGDDLVLRPRTVAAVAAARERGVRISLVTGRMTTSAIVFARGLALVDPIVAYQGALVRELPPPEPCTLTDCRSVSDRPGCAIRLAVRAPARSSSRCSPSPKWKLASFAWP